MFRQPVQSSIFSIDIELTHNDCSARHRFLIGIMFFFETASGASRTKWLSGLGMELFLGLLPALSSHLDRCKLALPYHVHRVPPVLAETIMCAGRALRDKRSIIGEERDDWSKIYIAATFIIMYYTTRYTSLCSNRLSPPPHRLTSHTNPLTALDLHSPATRTAGSLSQGGDWTSEGHPLHRLLM